MSKYPHLKLKLENKSFDDCFSIDLIHFTESIPFEFEFENSTYWIERGLLYFCSENTEISSTDIQIINPRTREKTTHNISSKNSFIYTIIGKISPLENKILLDLKAVSYILEKNLEYTLKFRSNKVVNELKIMFK